MKYIFETVNEAKKKIIFKRLFVTLKKAQYTEMTLPTNID